MVVVLRGRGGGGRVGDGSGGDGGGGVLIAHVQPRTNSAAHSRTLTHSFTHTHTRRQASIHSDIHCYQISFTSELLTRNLGTGRDNSAADNGDSVGGQMTAVMDGGAGVGKEGRGGEGGRSVGGRETNRQADRWIKKTGRNVDKKGVAAAGEKAGKQAGNQEGEQIDRQTGWPTNRQQGS